MKYQNSQVEYSFSEGNDSQLYLSRHEDRTTYSSLLQPSSTQVFDPLIATPTCPTEKSQIDYLELAEGSNSVELILNKARRSNAADDIIRCHVEQ